MSVLLPHGASKKPQKPSQPPFSGSAALPRTSAIPIGRLFVALAIAVIADVVFAPMNFFPWLDIPLDLGVAGVLWGIFGFSWVLVPAFLVEAIPGIGAVSPTWVLAVLGIAGIQWVKAK